MPIIPTGPCAQTKQVVPLKRDPEQETGLAAESERPAGSFVNFYWRCGGQVGRTLYVDHAGEAKDPTLLFGLVDTADIAAHIVEIHNWWLGLAEEATRIDGTGCAT